MKRQPTWNQTVARHRRGKPRFQETGMSSSHTSSSSRSRSLLRFVHRFNILYPLSAVAMFAGCCALSWALHADPDHTGQLLALLGVVNL
jgi:hypothetical protein